MIHGKDEHAGQPDVQASPGNHRVANTPVILGDLDGERLPQEGIVTAVRPEGLIIHTSAPFHVGDRVFIELPLILPADSPRTSIIRGKVTALREERGDTELQVRLVPMPDIPVTDIASSRLSSEEASTLVEDAQNRLRETAETGTLPVAHSVYLFHEPVTSATPAMQGRRGRRYVMAMAGIVLALLVLLWLLLPNTPFRPVSWQIKGLVGFEDASLSDETTPVELVTPSGLAGTGSPSGDQAAGPGYFVWRPGAWVYIEEQEVPPPPMAATTLPDVIPLFSPIGWVMAALQPVFPGASDRASVPPTLAFVVSVTLEPGSNLLPSPNANEALSPQLEMTQVFDGADVSAAPRSDANPQLPQPATPEAEQTHPPTRGSAPTETALPARAGSPAQGAASTPNPTTPLSQDPTENPNDGNTISQSPGEPHLPSHNNVPERVKIRIDKSEYALTIHFDGEPVAKFPVGLGRNDATPEGNFVIANKVTNPDWSDRGRIVKAGDPENPLGKRWMGLGTDGRTTSYGIHPTNEPESIGANMSRGCIRMRPEDAETVFRLCPSGTAVYIEP